MEYLGTVSSQIYQLSTCEINGRYFCVTGDSSLLTLSELKLGRRLICISSPLGIQLSHSGPEVRNLFSSEASEASSASGRLFDRGIQSSDIVSDTEDYPGGWTTSPDFAYLLLSACRFGERIFAFSVNRKKLPMMACLIDPFHDIYGQPISSIDGNPPAVELFELTGYADELDSGNPCWQLDDHRVAYCPTGGKDLYVFTLDFASKKLNIESFPAPLPGGMKYYSSILQRKNGELVMLGGNKRSERNDVYTFRVDGEKIVQTSLKPFVGDGKNSPGVCLYLDRFVIAFGGFTGSYSKEFIIYDLQTQESVVFSLDGKFLEKNQWTCMFVDDGFVYLIGGAKSNACHRVSLRLLANKILEEPLRTDFGKAIGLSEFQGGAGSSGTSSAASSAGSSAALALPNQQELRGWYLEQYRAIMKAYFPSRPISEPTGDIDFVGLYKEAVRARRARTGQQRG